MRSYLIVALALVLPACITNVIELDDASVEHVTTPDAAPDVYVAPADVYVMPDAGLNNACRYDNVYYDAGVIPEGTCYVCTLAPPGAGGGQWFVDYACLANHVDAGGCCWPDGGPP
jgi:hypothetical protein